jgi:hypothetical protein
MPAGPKTVSSSSQIYKHLRRTEQPCFVRRARAVKQLKQHIPDNEVPYKCIRYRIAMTLMLFSWLVPLGARRRPSRSEECARLQGVVCAFRSVGWQYLTEASCQLRVRTTDKSHIAAVKRAAEKTLREAILQLRPRRLLCKKPMVVPERVQSIADKPSDQTQHARHYFMGDVAALATDDVRKFQPKCLNTNVYGQLTTVLSFEFGITACGLSNTSGDARMNRSLHIRCCFYSPSLGTNYTITVFGGGNGQLQRFSSPGTQQAECKFQFAGECGRSWKKLLQQALASLFCRLSLGSTHQRRNETSQGACKVVHARGSDPTSVAFFLTSCSC